jgi:hypothetical protein
MSNVTTLKELEIKRNIVKSFEARPIALKNYIQEALELIEEGYRVGFYLEVLALMMRAYRGNLSQLVTDEQYKFLKENSRSYEFLMN